MTTLSAHSRRALFAAAPAALAVAPLAAAKNKNKNKKKGKKKKNRVEEPSSPPPPPEPLAHMIVLDIRAIGEPTNGSIQLNFRAVWLHPDSGKQGIVDTGFNVRVAQASDDLVTRTQELLHGFLQGQGLEVPAERVVVTLL